MTRFERDPLVGAIITFLAGRDRQTLDGIRQSIERTLDEAGDAGLRALSERFSMAGGDWTYYSSDPLARRLHHVVADRLLQPDSAVNGMAHLNGVADCPLVMFANHLSYADANLVEILLHRTGAGAIADRLTVTAGPKVYSSPTRRFSSLCFGTIKTPQNSAISSEDAVMNPREVARAARLSIDIAHERLRRGDVLLVFAEGTRSRTKEMHHTLAGAARYLELPRTHILPVSIVGTEALFPIGAETIDPVCVTVTLGEPIDADALRARARGGRRAMMDLVGEAIARLLPSEYRGVYS